MFGNVSGRAANARFVLSAGVSCLGAASAHAMADRGNPGSPETIAGGTTIPLWVWGVLVLAALCVAASVAAVIVLTRRTRAAASSPSEDDAWFRRLYENSPFGIIVCRLIEDDAGTPVDFLHLQANAATEQQTGFALADLIGRRASEVVDEATTADLSRLYGDVVKSGTPYSYSQYFPVYGRTLQVTAAHLSGDRFILFFMDITDRAQVEAALRDSESKLLDAQRMASLGYWWWDVKTGDVEWSEEVYRIFGLDPADFTPRIDSILALSAKWPEDSRRGDELIQKAIESREQGSYEQRFLRPDGATGYYASSFQGIYDAAGDLVAMKGTVQDITERKESEAERELLMLAIGQADEAIVITDSDAVMQYVNPAYEKTTGYARAEAIGRNANLLKSGEQDEAFYRRMWETLSAGGTWRGRLVNRKRDGTLFTEEAVITPVVDGVGETVNYVAVKRDITNELVLENQLRQAQKMEAVGRLAGGVAHDFNNMLGVILGHVDLILENSDPDSAVHEELLEIRKAGERSAGLTRQLLAFARKQVFAPRVIDLNETVAGMLKMLERLIGEDIEMAWLPEERVWPIKMDPGQIDQILANLCVNARDAIAGVGKVTIETGRTTFDEAYCRSHAGFVPGDFVLLAVSDDGCGMEPETVENIFEPFFTTKELGEGTGLGLATVYGIVKQNEGFINVYSEPGGGTTFRIYLRRHLAQAEPAPERRPAASVASGDETILLVEDEPAILNMAELMLESLGYTVLAADAPHSALTLAGAHDGEIHLLITDVVMPGMNGRELAAALVETRPGLRHVFMSGYTANVIAHHGVLDEDVNFIAKPFSRTELAAKVREALDG